MYNNIMLEIENIVKNYTLTKIEEIKVLKKISLSFSDTGFVSILGPSGCGKTTLLNIIGGLDRYTDGDLIIDGKSTKFYNDHDWDTYRNRKIGFVFQTYNLISHLSVLSNVEISLTLAGIGKEERKKQAISALKRVGLEDQIHKKPNQLSGGQMQRVAIARAIVNNPSIILADEPTGALDSETSVIVMDLLKEISKEKLVIMVTHNKDLSTKYSDRIIEMLDGQIKEDKVVKPENCINLQPVIKEKVIVNDEKKTKKEKTSMSFLTSLSLSLRNISAKKGRSILTAIASSFGVIGVGLVLALSNGFSSYVTRLEEATASNSPVTISNVTYSYKVNENLPTYDKFPDDDKIVVVQEEDTQSYISIAHRNNFTQDFINYLDNIDNTQYKGSVASKLINFNNLNLNMLSYNGSNYTYVNPYTNTDNSLTSSIASVTGLPKTILHEMYGKEAYIRKSYDVYGNYPSENGVDTDGDGEIDTFEIALVVDSYNRVTANTLVKFGLYEEEQIKEVQTIDFNNFIGKNYKFFVNDQLYDDSIKLSTIVSGGTETFTYKDLEGNTQTYDLDYPDSEICQYGEFMSYPNYYDDMYNGRFTLNGKQITPYNLKVTSILRVKKDAIIDYMPTSLCYTEGFKNFIVEKNSQSEYANTIKRNAAFGSSKELEKLLSTTNYISFFNTYFNKSVEVPSYMSELPETTIDQFVTAFGGLVKYYVPYVSYSNNSYVFNGSIFTNPAYFYQNCNERGSLFQKTDAISQVIDNVINGDFESLLKLIVKNPEVAKDAIIYFGYMISSSNNIKSIILFPSSLTKKPDMIQYLKNYNEGKSDADQIVYSDFIGTFTDSIGEMVNIISIVLVAFAAISLVVSSVMTGIITYNSVIERTKEIGIYRAIGARKNDVGRLFRSENILQGFGSGMIGIIFTYLLSIPINIIVNAMYPSYNIGSIAFLAPLAGFILLALAITLAFIAALIPAAVASNKDPVISLRTE